MKYKIILADPPWSYNDKLNMKGVHGMIRGAESFYNTMSLKEIKNLPIDKLSENNSMLFLWATMPLLTEAFDVIKAWGFEYKNVGFCWVKKTKNGKYHCGMGHYTRGNAELCLFASKGNVAKLVKDHSVRQIVDSKIMKHSKKPGEVRERIVQLFGDIPRIELFAREKIKGWDSMGYDIDGKDIREDLKNI